MSASPHWSVNGWELGETLFTEAQIADRVAALADEISEVYEGLEVTLVSILKGSFIFLADLTRRLSIPVRVDFLGLSSYVRTDSSAATWTTRLTTSVRDHHVLLVEDIADTGRTLLRVASYLEAQSPASLRVCALLDKPSGRESPARLDFVGFRAPDAFVVGYGLDVDGWFRQLPYIAVLHR